MDDRLLVETMRTRDPGAMGAVYDACAGRLFAYCWFLSRSRETAEVALRDALIVAIAHIDRLRSPDRLAAWLYALARVECGRHPASWERCPDMPIASHDQDDVDQRVMAWGAVMGLPWLTREVLELLLRHRLPVPCIAAVLAVVPKEVDAALARSRAELETALTAELLAHEGPYGCSGRAAILRARQGELTPALRARLRRHAEECDTCRVFLIDAVAPTKVYGLLPYAEPAPGLRERVLSCFVDPELTHYRDFVSCRADGFTKSGFPVQRHRGWDLRIPYDPVGGAIGPWRRLLHVAGGLAATAAIAGAVVALVRWAGFAQDREAGRAIAIRATPSVRVQPTPVLPGRSAPSPTPGGNGLPTSSSPAATLPNLTSVPSWVCDPAVPPATLPAPLDERLHGPIGPLGGIGTPPSPPERSANPAGPSSGPSGSSSGNPATRPSTSASRPSARPADPATPAPSRPSHPSTSAPPPSPPAAPPTVVPPATSAPPSRTAQLRYVLVPVGEAGHFGVNRHG